MGQVPSINRSGSVRKSKRKNQGSTVNEEETARTNREIVVLREKKQSPFNLFNFGGASSKRRKPRKPQNEKQRNMREDNVGGRRELNNPKLGKNVKGKANIEVHSSEKREITQVKSSSSYNTEEEVVRLPKADTRHIHKAQIKNKNSQVIEKSNEKVEKERRESSNQKFDNKRKSRNGNRKSGMPGNKRESEENDKHAGIGKGFIKAHTEQNKQKNLVHGQSSELSNACNEEAIESSSTDWKFQKENHEEEMNILIIGESGVGKSTWVNSIVNYLKYQNLEEAEKEGVVCVIPTNFIVTYATDDDIVRQVVQIGFQDTDEVVDLGKSVTQDPQTYTFYLGKKLVRLIDTPGLGDTAGIERDNENLNKILNHISFLKEIHGICILLKSNETRLGVLFKFCISGLLANLHKNAARNVVFCFTNSRSSFYAPGDTTSILEDYLRELNLADMINLSKETMFCLDNEAFRYLCTLKYENIPRKEHEKGEYTRSWIKSVSETRRLFDKIMTLKPHRVADTTHLCSVKSKIYNLMEPIADISKTIQMNLAVRENQLHNINKAKENKVDKLKNLNITNIVTKGVPLEYPQMVCRSEQCIRTYQLKVSNVTITEYPKICHNKCRLVNLIEDVGSDKRLKECKAFNFQGKCRKCGCSWKNHRHVTYTLTKEEVDSLNSVVEDEKVVKDVELKRKLGKFKKSVEENMKTYREEQDFILETCLKFKIFLKENGLVQNNDSFRDYLKDAIREEKKKVNANKIDEEVLSNLNELLKRYEERAKKIDSEMQGESKSLTPNDIIDLMEKLYKLELTGKQIKHSAELAYSSNRRNQIYAEKPLPIDPVLFF